MVRTLASMPGEVRSASLDFLWTTLITKKQLAKSAEAIVSSFCPVDREEIRDLPNSFLHLPEGAVKKHEDSIGLF